MNYVTRDEFNTVVESLRVRGDESTVMVEESPGGTIIRSINIVSAPGSGGTDAVAYNGPFAITLETSPVKIDIAPGYIFVGRTRVIINDGDLDISSFSGNGRCAIVLTYDSTGASVAITTPFTDYAGSALYDQADTGNGAAFRIAIGAVTLVSNVPTSVEQWVTGDLQLPRVGST